MFSPSQSTRCGISKKEMKKKKKKKKKKSNTNSDHVRSGISLNTHLFIISLMPLMSRRHVICAAGLYST
ncbi:hypothetical protein I7I50_07103 [Histoplasma capsulatum G186AR]|uniref:Uncharacterized protein n=1 Tax=Ajellomyces capsulatus TaxID=5037 RepID=A0A8H7YYG0_AJECA|nr:hypothetical protein I7I52_09854 [Histoplasma capsulatum]QSS67893.1 hypothetical protein I7I50_07103 [Histoplasma capsulatum G186AR]